MMGIATKMRKAVVSRSSGRSGYSTDRFTGYAGGGGGGGIAIVLLPSRSLHAIPRLHVVFRKRSSDGCPIITMHGRPLPRRQTGRAAVAGAQRGPPGSGGSLSRVEAQGAGYPFQLDGPDP